MYFAVSTSRREDDQSTESDSSIESERLSSVKRQKVEQHHGKLKTYTYTTKGE